MVNIGHPHQLSNEYLTKILQTIDTLCERKVPLFDFKVFLLIKGYLDSWRVKDLVLKNNLPAPHRLEKFSKHYNLTRRLANEEKAIMMKFYHCLSMTISVI